MAKYKVGDILKLDFGSGSFSLDEVIAIKEHDYILEVIEASSDLEYDAGCRKGDIGRFSIQDVDSNKLCSLDKIKEFESDLKDLINGDG